MQVGVTRTPTWRPVYTASKWTTLLAGMRDTVGKRKMTNAEAVAFIREWRDVAQSGGPLWYQFAATAYGYAPPRRTLVRTAAQAAKSYPMTPALWTWASSIATELDSRPDAQFPARIAVNKDTFMDPVWFGNVLSKIEEDGGIKPPAPAKSQPAKQQGSGGLLILAVLAWMVLTPNRRSRG